MKLEITPNQRIFDGRTVYLWKLTDDQGRLRDSGCALSHASAVRAGNRSISAQGPALLLDMLECHDGPARSAHHP
jgi:hypothetical protein